MIKIIVNPTAGGGSAVDHASTLARACADAGISVHVHVAANRDDSVRTAMETAPRVGAAGGKKGEAVHRSPSLFGHATRCEADGTLTYTSNCSRAKHERHA